MIARRNKEEDASDSNIAATLKVKEQIGSDVRPPPPPPHQQQHIIRNPKPLLHFLDRCVIAVVC